MIWLVGGNGMLGTEIKEKLEDEDLEFVSTDIEVDITDKDALNQFVSGRDISWIINASAYTAVDKAESEEDKAELINGVGAGNLAETAKALDAKLIHFSTDYVYSGEGTEPYNETSPVAPVSAYGRTKLNGEKAVIGTWEKFFIFRISWLYGVYGHNFVKTMIRFFNERPEMRIVSDQTGAPTYTETLAENIVRFIKKDSDHYGIYNYSDDAEISWYDFAVEICRQGASRGLCPDTVKISPIKTEEFPTPAKRPANSRFNKSKVKNLGFEVKDWKDNLNRYFDKLETIG